MKSLKERLLAHGIAWLGKENPEAKFEIDDVNGKKLSFPNIGSVAEIKEGVEVTAEDGEHVLTIDNITYTVTVTGGKVSAVVEVPKEEENNGAEEFIQATAEAFAEIHKQFEAYKAEAKAENDSLRAEISNLVTNLGHKKEDPEVKKTVVVNGKEFDKSKIKFN